MTNVKKLMDQTFSFAMEHAKKQDAEMYMLYMDDLEDFKDITYLFEAGYTKAAIKQLEELDTFPREQYESALKADGFI